jgi:hypothetical protein
MNQQVGSLSVRVGVQCAGVLSFLEYLQDAVVSGDITPVTATKLEELLKGVTVVTASPDANVEANRQMLLDRSVVGLKKYGVTTERTDLNLQQWLQHILEELLDAANYVQATKMQLKRDEQVARAAFEEGFRMRGEADSASPNGCVWRSTEEAWANSDTQERFE